MTAGNNENIRCLLSEERIRETLSDIGGVAVFAKSPDYLVLLKGPGIPSAPLAGGKRSALEAVSEEYPEILAVKGKNSLEGGLIHRIDESTAGLLLVARTQLFFDDVNSAQKEGRFIKHYTAYCSSEIQKTPKELKTLKTLIEPEYQMFSDKNLPFVIESRFRSLGEKGAMVKPVFENTAGRADRKKAGYALYRTVVEDMEPFKIESDALLRIHCRISAGFRHQVRSHLSAAGYPVLGDVLYGNDAYPASRMLFFASGLEIKGTGVSVILPETILDDLASAAVRK